MIYICMVTDHVLFIDEVSDQYMFPFWITSQGYLAFKFIVASYHLEWIKPRVMESFWISVFNVTYFDIFFAFRLQPVVVKVCIYPSF